MCELPLLLQPSPSAPPSVTGHLSLREGGRDEGERVWVSVSALPGHMIWRAGPPWRMTHLYSHLEGQHLLLVSSVGAAWLEANGSKNSPHGCPGSRHYRLRGSERGFLQRLKIKSFLKVVGWAICWVLHKSLPSVNLAWRNLAREIVFPRSMLGL